MTRQTRIKVSSEEECVPARNGANQGGDLTQQLGPIFLILLEGWFRFSYSSPNTLHASQLETAYHGTHVECLHGLMATGRIMPSNDKVAGMRHFDGRQGVYLHRPSNKHLAQGYAAFIRFGPKHVYLRALCEVEVDPAGSAKRGKKTNQLIYEYDSVRISAFHLQIATKSELKQGEYLREWAGTLEVPLSAALEAFEAF